MKSMIGVAAVAALTLLSFDVADAGKSRGGLIGADRLHPGRAYKTQRILAPVESRPAATADTETERSFSFEPGRGGPACCTVAPTCCHPQPLCVTAQPPQEKTARSFSFEPSAEDIQAVPVEGPRNRRRDRIHRKLHPGTGWRR